MWVYENGLYKAMDTHLHSFCCFKQNIGWCMRKIGNNQYDSKKTQFDTNFATKKSLAFGIHQCQNSFIAQLQGIFLVKV